MEKRSRLLQRHESSLDILSPAPKMIIPAFDAFCENIAAIYEKCKAWLPDGDSQILRLYVFGPSGLKDYASATLRCKI